MKRELEIKTGYINNNFDTDSGMENTIHAEKTVLINNRASQSFLKFNNNLLKKEAKTISEQDNHYFLEILSGFCSLIKTKKSPDEIFKCFNFYANKIGYNFIAICLPDLKENSLTVKTYYENRELNNFQFSLSDEFNYLIQSYFDKSRRFASYRDLFIINCPVQNEYLTIPLLFQGECVGIAVAGSSSKNRVKDEFINTLCSYLALLISNHNFVAKLNSFTDIDNLTDFYIHGKFQEKLSEVLKEAKECNEKVSVAIFDINNISGINREFGHSKGDEAILLLAGQIRKNMRKTDIAGRYGDDEIAVIMPRTENTKAKIIAKKIISDLSECEISRVGKINASVGIATYPDSAANQEKLLLLAEQSMLISAKKEKSSVLSSKDIDFWNQNALDSLSKVISKRNLQHRFSFEDEIVRQFQHENKTSKIPMEVITSLAAAIDAKDTYTRGHSQSVSEYAEELAKALKLSEQMIERVKLAAILHDIGKIGIAESILRKPGALTDHEWAVMKQHPIIGVKKILEPIKSLKDLIPIVRHHHERYDGLGYPDRLKGDEIPLGARIVSIADSFHALISNRPYRKALGTKKALEILQAGAGKQWDKELVEKFISLYVT